jgi:CubicO group peptidase (beta-lactamase class C family)
MGRMSGHGTGLRWARARRRAAAICAGGAIAVGALGVPPSSAAPGSTPFDLESARLSSGLVEALNGSGLDGLVDFGSNTGRAAAGPAEHLPNVDLAVIELTASGEIAGVANVLYDRDDPAGYQVAIDPQTLQTQGVEFARWRQARWDEQDEWEAGPAEEDVTVAADDPGKRYMAAYPASVLKLMVAYSVYRLVDEGRLGLSDEVTYRERKGRSCGYRPSNPTGVSPAPEAEGAADTLAGWLDQMITVSDGFATCVLLQAIDDADALEEANEHFAEIGLPSLRMLPAEPEVGNGWSSGTMSMGALDTAKLLALVSGAPGVRWTAPDGSEVTGERVLSAESRAAFRADLAEQSFNEVLNPVNLCGSTDAVQGIPSTVPERWVDAASGAVLTSDGDLVIDFGFDTRLCGELARVEFLHKPGLTFNAGGDAGIVRALPDQDGRWYVVAVLSNVGYRFGDPDWALSQPNACEGAPYVCYPRGFGRLGKAIDDLVLARPPDVR